MQDNISIYSIILDTIFALTIVVFAIGTYKETKKALMDQVKKEQHKSLP